MVAYKIINSTLVIMRESVTQLDELGCGLACVAFIGNLNYQSARSFLGHNEARVHGFYCRDIVRLLRVLGHGYAYKYVNKKTKPLIFMEGSIVYIRKSKEYPKGHYLTRTQGRWMDPWINFKQNQDIKLAYSGYRNRLPGQPIYVVYKELE